MLDINLQQSHELAAHIAHEYGHVVKYNGFLGVKFLCLTDPTTDDSADRAVIYDRCRSLVSHP